MTSHTSLSTSSVLFLRLSHLPFLTILPIIGLSFPYLFCLRHSPEDICKGRTVQFHLFNWCLWFSMWTLPEGHKGILLNVWVSYFWLHTPGWMDGWMSSCLHTKVRFICSKKTVFVPRELSTCCSLSWGTHQQRWQQQFVSSSRPTSSFSRSPPR